MKKKLGFLWIFVLVAVLFAATTALAASKPIVMRLANVAPVGDARDLSCQKFAELAAQKTNGAVKIEVFSGGTLGDWRVTIEGLKPGIVQIVLESLGTIEPYTKYAAIDPYPFLYRDEDHFMKVWSSELGQQLLDKIGDEGDFKLLGAQYRGARYVTSKKKFTNAAELAGLKIRVPQLKMYLRTWELLGAAPTPMAATEIYTALQQGTVEAQENPLSFNYSGAFYEVCPYLVVTKHVLSNDLFIFDKNFFNGLPEEIRHALSEAAMEAAKWRTEYEIAQENEYIKKFQEKNVEVVYPDVASLKAKVENILVDFPHLKEIVEQIQAVK